MVTGGGSGLGLAVAERLVELGARVVVLDLRPPVALLPGAAYVEADVGSEAAVDPCHSEGGTEREQAKGGKEHGEVGNTSERERGAGD